MPDTRTYQLCYLCHAAPPLDGKKVCGTCFGKIKIAGRKFGMWAKRHLKKRKKTVDTHPARV